MLATLIPNPSLAETPRTVQAWGGNGSGDLGIGNPSFGETLPQQVIDLSDVKAIAGGNFHSLALLTNGTLRAWGGNQQGQLGNGKTSGGEVTPVEVRRLIGVKAVAAGTHSLALLSNGMVTTWGDNSFGQLGNGNFDNSDIPKAVGGLPLQITDGAGVIAIAAGHAHSLALLDDGTVFAWGRNIDGQLCDGTRLNRSTPVKSLFRNVKAIAAGETVSVALLTDGTVRTCGGSNVGQLGDGDISLHHTTSPVFVHGLKNVQAIDAGEDHSLALRADGKIFSWGLNNHGQLGDGTFVNRSTAVAVVDLSGAVEINAGGFHSLALTGDGQVRAWGFNSTGQLGDGSFSDSAVPVVVLNETGSEVLKDVTALSASSRSSSALR